MINIDSLGGFRQCDNCVVLIAYHIHTLYVVLPTKSSQGQSKICFDPTHIWWGAHPSWCIKHMEVAVATRANPCAMTIY